ncbi:uncharacterized protein PV09_01332 [Verruconis gallopava]|uniref:BZIP domain-containing protein n=1 Tax=Verruconis gallopava TaxID=253628 RepID=A0A0D2BAV4_9PEZI|nr:uncharacterized protein PV09_01332 [Verruconis gallopava]KIW08429.1 hypothetical protein PV09_01332 [Verruconis gallopava]
MQQTMAQNFFPGPDFKPVEEMYGTGIMPFDNSQSTSSWPVTAVGCSPTLFGATATDAWAMNTNPLSNLQSLESSSTAFDNAFVSSPESVTPQFLGDLSSDQSHEDALQLSGTWKSINSERSSFSSSNTDFEVKEYTKEDPARTERAQRRRRKNLDPKQRHADKLEKNRKAAERCRQKQRSYVSTLQERAREEEIKRARLIAQVSQLRDDILSLKESMVSHSGCNDERIQQYLLSELQKSTSRRTSSVSSIPSMHISPPLQEEILRQQVS